MSNIKGSSDSSSSESNNSSKKIASKGKVKTVASSAASKEKQDKKGIGNSPERPKRNTGIVDYKELQQKPPKKIKAPKKTMKTKEFFSMNEMRLAVEDRMSDDFEDFVVGEGCDAYLIHKKNLEKVRVEEVDGAKVMISQGSGNSTFWVKATQLLGNFDGEIRDGRVGLYKRKNSLPVLVEIVKSGDQKSEVKNFNEGEESTSWKVFTNQVKMAAPSTLRGFLKKHKITEKKKKSNLGKKNGSDFSFQSFLKTQAERDEARNEMTMKIIEQQGTRFEKLLESQQTQFNALITALGSGRNARTDNSSEKNDGVDKSDASEGSGDDDAISG